MSAIDTAAMAPAWSPAREGTSALLGESIQVDAPAKINMFLEVLGRGDDGFHEIETVMTAVDRYDELNAWGRDDAEIDCRMRWGMGLTARQREVFGPLPQGRANLAHRALELLRSRGGVRKGISLRFVKRIPAESGMGGASSDAASALVAANRLWNLKWSRDQLAKLSEELGSDIPFFVMGHSLAVCRGRGEEIEPFGSCERIHMVVARPTEGLPTSVVYQSLTASERGPSDRRRFGEPHNRKNVRRMVASLFNRLEAAAMRNSSAARQVAADFRRLNFLGQQLTGSGSCYFGICRSHRQAQRWTRLLGARCGGHVFKVTTLGLASNTDP